MNSLRQELGRQHLWVRGSDPAMAKVAETVATRLPAMPRYCCWAKPAPARRSWRAPSTCKVPGRDQPFVAVNCAVLKGELLESELFGHEKGAFTGADRARAGRVETARGGTLFLDEIGELAPDLQAKLLRLLQEKEYERLGSDRTQPADVRLIAATHRDLGAAIRDGAFREDLYYRLKVISIKMPALRERTADILLLAEWLLEKHAADSRRQAPRLTEKVRQALQRYAWPGNVRELSNVMERCALLAGDAVALCDLPEELMDGALAPTATVTQIEDLFALPYGEAVTAARRLIVSRALEQAGGHQTRAADRLGVTQPYLSRLTRQLGIRREDG